MKSSEVSAEQFQADLSQVCFGADHLRGLDLTDILGPIPTIDSVPIPRGAVVFVRADLDVPVRDGTVVDDTRLRTCLETFNYCVAQGWRTVLIGHLGRNSNNSLKPVASTLAEIMNQRVEFVEDWLDLNGMASASLKSSLANVGDGGLLMLENARRYDIEQSLWDISKDEFPDASRSCYRTAASLRTLGGFEINEAISASNLDFSSAALPLVMARVATGYFLREELGQHLEQARSANVLIFSGLKANKLDDLHGILDRGHVREVIAGGAVAMALVKADSVRRGQDVSIGRAENDPGYAGYMSSARIEQAESILRACDAQSIRVHLPEDYVLEDGTISRSIPANSAQMDIGPATRQRFRRVLVDFLQENERAIVFVNGVFGKVEDDRFEEGTRALYDLLPRLSESGARIFVGGGDGRLALLRFGQQESVTRAFTAGGTVLKLMAGKQIAYLVAMYLSSLRRNAPE